MATDFSEMKAVSETPIFYETLAAVLHIDVPLAAGIYREAAKVTDLHRIGESLDWAV
jgi:hypothetical protein